MHQDEIRNMEYEHEKGTRGTVLIIMKSGIWDNETCPILEYGKGETMKLGTWNNVILKFELGNLQGPLGGPSNSCTVTLESIVISGRMIKRNGTERGHNSCREF